MVTAGAPEIPQPLLQQLAVGACLVIPVGGYLTQQQLLRVTRSDDSSHTSEALADVAFVPLVGEAGWSEEDERKLRPE